MLFRVGTQLQLSDDTVAGFRRDGDPDGGSLPAVRRLVLEWLDICPLRVRTCWERTLRQWPIPPGPFPRVLLLQHDLDDSGRDQMQPLHFWQYDFGVVNLPLSPVLLAMHPPAISISGPLGAHT